MYSTDANHGGEKRARPRRARGSCNLGDDGSEIKQNETLPMFELLLACPKKERPARERGPSLFYEPRLLDRSVAERSNTLSGRSHQTKPTTSAGRNRSD